MRSTISSNPSSSVPTLKKRTRRGSTRIPVKDHDSNHEDFLLIWLTDKDNNAIQGQLRSIINYLKVFHNIGQCVKYVLSIKTEKTFLIISETFSKDVIPRIHEHAQLERIYIYCHRRSNLEILAQTYAKITGIFKDKQLMVEKLKEDYRVSFNNLWSTNILTPTKSVHTVRRENSADNWFPPLIETIIRTPQSDSIRKKLLNDCEIDYLDNESEEKAIEDFRQNYKPSDVISWYKRHCFIYRLLNKALRLQDIVTLFKFRFFLADMQQQLEKFRSDYFGELPTNRQQLTFYRGQGISSEELNKIKVSVGKSISINVYFLTTTHFQTAMTCATNSERSSFVESIVFDINVDRTIARLTKPFGKINENQNEILFSPGTIFQNESIEQCDTVWYVKLRLIHERNLNEINSVDEILKQEPLLVSPLISVGAFLWKIGQYNKAESIFHILCEELSTGNYNEVSVIYNDIGILHNDRGAYVDALNYYEKSLKYAKKVHPPNSAEIGTILNNIGSVYANKKDHLTALKYYKEALQINLESVKLKQTDLADIAASYTNIGCIYTDMLLFSRALINLEKALDIQLKEMPSDHPAIGQSYNHIGYIYYRQGNFSKALKTYHLALDISIASLPSNHMNLFKIYNNIGTVHFITQKYSLAIEYYEKAIALTSDLLTRDHSILAKTFYSMACVYKSMKNHSMALKYFRKALQIEKHRSKPNHALLFDIYAHIGVNYESKGKNTTARSYYKAGLTHGLKTKVQNYSRIRTVEYAIERCVNRAEN